MGNSDTSVFWGIAAALFLLPLLWGCGKGDGASMSKEEAREAYVGQWTEAQDGAISIDIWSDGGDAYEVSISSPGDGDEMYFWELSGTLEGGAIVYTSGTKTSITYDDYGETVEEEVYADGRGRLYLRDARLYWEDKKEDFGRGHVLERVGEE